MAKDALEKKIDALTRIVKKGFAGVDRQMEGGFAAVAGDIADIKRDMATKLQVIALHTQVNSIEAQLKHGHRRKIPQPLLPLARMRERADSPATSAAINSAARHTSLKCQVAHYNVTSAHEHLRF